MSATAAVGIAHRLSGQRTLSSTIKQIQALVRNGLYYLTEHADHEAVPDGFDVYDVEHGILTGEIRRTCPEWASIRLSVRRSVDAGLALYAS